MNALAALAAATLASQTGPFYATPDARKLAARAIAAHAALKHARIETTSARGTSLIWLSAGRLRERQAKVEWTLSGGFLTVRDRQSGKLFRGRAQISSVAEWLGRIGRSPDPLLRQMTSSKGLVRSLIGPRMRVASGSIVRVGATFGLIRAEGRGLAITLWINSRSLVERIESRSFDAQGKTVSLGERDIAYISVGTRLPDTDFLLQGKALPLSRLGKR